MKIFLAGATGFFDNYLKDFDLEKNPVYILESFFYMDDQKAKKIRLFKDFLLDSGAYTFMQSSKNHPNWNGYLDRYISFVNRHDIKNFFELDIDLITGYDKVKDLRKQLELGTGKQCMPVFHKNRGVKEWERMCEEYPYVAIGTIYEYNHRPDILLALLKIADKYKTKVHGLGFTRLDLLDKVPFYSVDSTSWLCGTRFGYIYRFNGKIPEQVKRPEGKKLTHASKTIKHSFQEWVKFQQYMDTE